MPLVFVYGTLKAGFVNHHLTVGVRQPGVHRTRDRLRLVLLGEGHVPCLLLAPGGGHQVMGEVYEVSDGVLADMDRLERLGEPGGYLRQTIDVETLGDTGEVVAVISPWAYGKLPEQAAVDANRAGPLQEYTAEHAARFKW